MNQLITPLFIAALVVALIAAWLARPSVVALVTAISVVLLAVGAVIWRLA